LHVAHRALGKNLAQVENGDFSGDARHEFHVVFGPPEYARTSRPAEEGCAVMSRRFLARVVCSDHW
jgi:hypothetical protein